MATVVWKHEAAPGEKVYTRLEGDALVVWVEAGEVPEPETLEEAIRSKAWESAGLRQTIPRNENAAFLKHAREWSLGAPITRETSDDDVVFDSARYRIQGYAERILYAVVGDDGEWIGGRVMRLDW